LLLHTGTINATALGFDGKRVLFAPFQCLCERELDQRRTPVLRFDIKNSGGEKDGPALNYYVPGDLEAKIAYFVAHYTDRSAPFVGGRKVGAITSINWRSGKTRVAGDWHDTIQNQRLWWGRLRWSDLSLTARRLLDQLTRMSINIARVRANR
jgi:hypothetical protein